MSSAPQAVGQQTSRITQRTNTSVGCSTGGCFVIAAGGDTQSTMTYAHGGTIGVYAAVVPPSDQLHCLVGRAGVRTRQTRRDCRVS